MKHVAVILAAGSGERLGGVAKALLELDGMSYLARIVATARAAGAATALVVVGGPFLDVVHAAVGGIEGARAVINPDASRGMASSISAGFGALPNDADAAWLWPVDHPRVRESTLRALFDRFDGDHHVVRPTFQGRGGHPPLVGRGRFSALAACTFAPNGARDIIRSEDTLDVPVDDPGVVRDVDEPKDILA